MAGSITLTADVANERIGVQLSGWTTDAQVAVYRVHPDTSEYPLRGSGFSGAVVTSGGSAFAWDYETPFGVAVTYYAFDGATKVQATTTLAITKPMLRTPGLPGNDADFDLIARPKVTYAKPGAILPILGSDADVVVSDTRKAGTFTIEVETQTSTQAEALLAAIGRGGRGSTNLLLLPGTRQAWQYVAVGDVEEEPLSPLLPVSSSPDPVRFTLPCRVTNRPVGGIYGDPTASYQVIKDTYATYAAVKAAKGSYLNVLQGV